MISNHRATLYMLTSTLSLSLTGLLAKNLTGTMSVELLSFLRFVIPALLLLAVAAISELTFPPRNMLKPIVFRALCIAGCQSCFLISLETLSLVESVVLFATSPLFIPVLEKLFFGLKIKTETKFALVATFIGVLMLAGDVSGIQLKPELLYGLTAGILSAASQVSLFHSSKGNMTPVSLNGWTFLFAALSLLPVLAFSGLSALDLNFLSQPVEQAWIWRIILVFSICIIANQIFRFKAYKLGESNSQLAPLIFTNLIFTAVWQLAFFDESFSNYQLLGIALIVTASLMNNFAVKLFRQHHVKL